MALSTDILLGVPYNVGGTLREVDASTVVDNVFTFSSNGKKWQRVFDGGNSVYRASWLNITGAPADKSSLVAIALASSAIQTLEVDTTIQIDGAVDFSGKTLSVKSGGLVTGTYTISNAVIEGNLTQKILEPTGTLTTSKSATGKWHPTWFGAAGDGITDDYIAVNYACVTANTNAQKTISLLSGTYLLGSGLSVPDTTVLEFENGAIIDGAVTVTGNGAFFNASIYQRVFGSSIIISGLYPQTSEISPVNFGAVRNGVTDTTAAQQKMWNYVATLTDVYTNIVYPPGNYYQAGTVTLPGDMGQQRFVDITGYGVQIITDQDVVLWDRMPVSMTESSDFIDSWVGTISGFFFRGNSTIAAQKTNQIALRIGATYSWRYQDVMFYRFHNGMEAYFSLQGRWTNIRSVQCTGSTIVGRHGNWTGASVSNTSFNANTIEHCRFTNIGNSFATLYFLAADQLNVNDVIIEGQKPQYGIYYDDFGNTGVLTNTFQNIWFENTGGVVTTSTNFYLDCRGITTLRNIQRIYPDYLFEASPRSGSRVIIEGLPYVANIPATGLFKIPNTLTGVTFVFKELPPDGASFVFDSTSWVDGVMPLQMMAMESPRPTNAGFLNKSTGNPIYESSSGTSITVPSTVITRAALSINTTNTLSSTNGTKLYVSHTRDGSVAAALRIGIMSVFGSSTIVNGYDAVYSGTAATLGGRINLIRSRGTTDTPVIVNNNDLLGAMYAYGYDGAAIIEGGSVRFNVDGTPSSGIMPSRMRIYTRNSSGTLNEVLGIRATGQIEILIAPATGALTDGILTLTSGGALRQIATSSIIGTGVINTLGYFDANGGAIKSLTAITASRALKSDANGLPVAFDTATEPSLTELSYVKGVTSAIQTQIDAKISSASIVSGLYATNGDGVLTTFTVTHGFAGTPTNVQVTPAGVDSAVPFFANNITATTFDVTFTTPPIVGTNNVTFYWTAK